MGRAGKLLLLLVLAGLALVGSTPLGWRTALILLPGVERHDAAALEPAFAACLAGLLDDLTRSGYRPLIRTSWRDAERQRLYHRLGGSQRASGSLHQVEDASGRPAARAADVAELWPMFLFGRHAAFFLELREKAPRYGLVTGGSWSRSDPRWAAYGLGWDPAHVEGGGKGGSCLDIQ